jgi:acetyl/propionyl-CoA carboxylase alpha subunit/acetyl-CoA carboxylase carboxyltransferase component
LFSRIAIVNRGEPAMRLINAVRELAAETGQPIETVALYTDADRTATFVREADIAYDLGPAAARPYLDLKLLERALVATEADAAWVGWGFVAEDPAFADLCDTIGVTFIGPSADAMRKLGDKIGAKLIAENIGVPVAPWSHGAVQDLDAVVRVAREIGYPLMLKATAGGGGRGIRMISSEEQLVDAFERTSQEAARAFGNGTVFLERLITGARHVEVQVIADGQGTAWALGIRDCSLQRRHQKVIEESASPTLSSEQAALLRDSAERLAVAVDYRGAATVEFLYRAEDQLLAFLEVNTRLQVEHPVTELTTGADLVRLQLHVAAGGTLDGERPAERGHAVEARLNAEDPDRDFAPSPGRIVRLDLPAGPGVRVDAGVNAGDTIPADFDSMIAKIIAYGRDRDQALGRLRRALAQTAVVIDGGTTNKSFLLDLLNQPEVIDASADTGWIDRVRAAGRLTSHRHSGVALAAAAIEAYEAEEQIARSTAFGGHPRAQHETGRQLELSLRGVAYRLRVARISARRFRVAIEAASGTHRADIELDRFDEHARQLTVNGSRYRLLTATHGPVHLVEMAGATYRISREEASVVRSPAPALVVATPLAVGAEVEAGAPVLVLESMKMETVLRAPFKALVKECLVSVGSRVETSAPLLKLEPVTSGGDTEAGDVPGTGGADLDLPAEPAEMTAAARVRRGQETLRSLLLGFDGDLLDEGQILDDYLATREMAAAEGHSPVAGEVELIEVFADLAELARDRPASEDGDGDGHLHSPREYFHSYRQCLDVERAGLPEAFTAKLARALRHYGVAKLERSPELEAAVSRVFFSPRPASADATLMAALLRAWLQEPPPDVLLHESASLALERLVVAAQVRFPLLANLARCVVFTWFVQPRLRRDRARTYVRVREHLRYLDAQPDAADRAERVAAIVRSTEPLMRLLGQRLARGCLANAVMLEVLTRRYYGNKSLTAVRSSQFADCTLLVAERADSRLIAAAATFDAFGSALRHLTELGIEGAVDADIYLAWEEQPDNPDATAAALSEVIDEHRLPGQVRRLVVTVAGSHGAVMHHHFTFCPSGTGLSENRLIRGLHPDIARRIRLDRLSQFDLTRLPSVDEEVYLFQALARKNPSDARLFAFAQVRDLPELRDYDGRLVTLPTVESAIEASLNSIRHAMSRQETVDGTAARHGANGIVIYVWPTSDTLREDLETLLERMLPTMAGAGLDEVLIIARQRDEQTGKPVKIALRCAFDTVGGTTLTVGEPPDDPVEPLDDYRQKVLRAARRGNVYPYELTDLLAGASGSFTEYDLDACGALAAVDRPRGKNTAGIVVGVVSTPTGRYPEGVTRVALLGDPTRSLGALSEPECARVIAALDLAARMGVPVEWFALSSGARISMDSGSENLDQVAAALKRIVEFTQAGGEINVVVAGINVGAQPYWNAEATMLMHTRGVLVMTPDSAMVLTGKQALDFSGGVSAEDNFGIGGYDRVMGPSGQAQYWAPDLAGACDVLMAHYEHAYTAPGEEFPRRAVTADPAGRDVSGYPHPLAGSGFATVGEIFSAEKNADRKKPFDIRTVMRAVSDQDHPVLERWAAMAGAEISVVQDAHLGGRPVCLIGIESRTVARRGFPPTDGPDTYTAGTLFPLSSKKTARAINAASGSRPVVVLANLSGFDGSPESMRSLQLEYGAEIGRAIVNFQGPIVFCVISRYHGGAFVVFSKRLNPNMTVLALEGSFASVLGGAPAAAVVFAAEVSKRTATDPRVAGLQARIGESGTGDRAALSAELAELQTSVRAEKLGEVAAEFDRIHSIQRAVEVGSVDAIISVAEMRPRIIEAIERGLVG